MLIFRIIVLVLALLSPLASADRFNGEMEITKIADNLYLHTSYKKLPDFGFFPSNGLIVVEQGEAYIIDTPWLKKDTEVLIDWIRLAGFDIKAALVTHSHDDRSSGLSILKEQAVATYAYSQTNALLAARGETPALHAFDEREFVLLQGAIEVYYLGPGHTSDNIVVWLPKQRVLFGGCLVRSALTQTLGNIADAHLDAWARTVRAIEETVSAIQWVVPGHGPIGGDELLAHTIQLVETANSGE